MTNRLPARQRRTHAIEFKTELVALCHQPGASVSAVALTHGVNANLLRRWMKQYPDGSTPVAPSPSKLVPVQVEASHITAAAADIHLDIQRGTTRIHLRWPLAGAAACAQLLGSLLK